MHASIHRCVLIERSSVTRPYLTRWFCRVVTCRLDVLPQRTEIERPRGPQGPRERSAALGEIETCQVRMHVSAPARQRIARIGDARTLDHHDPQQV